MKKLFLVLLFIHCSLIIANAQWVMVNDYGPAQSFCNNDNILYASVEGRGVYKTTNFGIDWILTGNNITPQPFYSLVAKDSLVFLGAYSLYKSTNFGISWDSVKSINFHIYTLTISNEFIFANNNYSVGRSSNWGENWISLNNGLPTNYPGIRSLASFKNIIYAGIETSNPITNDVYKSVDTGNYWSCLNSNISGNPYNLYVDSNLILSGCTFGVFISTNSGVNWRKIDEIPGNIGLFGFASSGTKNIFISAWSYGFYVSNNYGQTWMQRNEGLLNSAVTSLHKFGNYLFMGSNPTYGPGGIYRRPLNDVIGINNITSEIPKEIKLYQNYPNPFNGTSKIKYQVRAEYGSQKSEVRITIYDILGKEIATLINQRLSTGDYEVNFDGSLFPSGIYFYSLYIDGKVLDTKKLVLLK